GPPEHPPPAAQRPDVPRNRRPVEHHREDHPAAGPQPGPGDSPRMTDLTYDLPSDGEGGLALLTPTTLLPDLDPVSSSRPTPAERSDLIDRAYEEYRQLRGAGVEVDPDAFCARFPAFQTSLRRLLEVHREVEDNPELIDQIGARWPEPGDEFHGFRLLQELGRGAFARVFLARERAVGGRLVAVKVSLHA